MPYSSYIHNYTLEPGPQQDGVCVCVCVRHTRQGHSAHVRMHGRENAGARHLEFVNVLGKLPTH